MDDQKKEQSEFNLDDIMKEFGAPEKATMPIEPEEDVRVWDGVIPETSAPTLPAEDTVRLDEITRAVRQAQEASNETVRFTPVGGQEEEPEPYIPPIQEEKVEPYSEQWEPEYEQPIGEYIPQQPIVFRPKNRLKELKRKLVEGPEKRYYELAEKGLGKLLVTIFLSVLVALLAVGTTVLYAIGVIGDHRIRFLVFSQVLFLLLSALLGSYQLIDGFMDLIRKRFTLNTLLLFGFVACCADAILCLRFLRVPCCGAYSINMTMALWSAYQRRKTEMAQMDTMRKATNLEGIAVCEDLYEGRPGFLRKEGQVEDFMDHYKSKPSAEKTLSVYAIVALFVSFGIGVLAGVLHSAVLGIQSFCAALLVALPATAYITLSRPMALLERRLHKLGTVICGWQGVRNLSRNGVFPVTDADLFPAGAAVLNGVKFYGNRQPDETVAYATALIAADGGGMAPLFEQLLESRNGYHYEAENLQSYNGGLGGEVNGEPVLAGTASFLQNMGVDMPQGTQVNQAVYVAIDGSLCGVFAVTYHKTKSAATGLTTLCAYRGLTPVLVAGDFMLTGGFLRSKFGVNVRRIAFPPRSVRRQLESVVPQEDTSSQALTTREGLAAFAYAVTGARAVRTASVVGVIIHMIGGILGLLSVLALTLVGAEHLLTPINLLLYELIWMIPGFLVTEWTRNV